MDDVDKCADVDDLASVLSEYHWLEREVGTFTDRTGLRRRLVKVSATAVSLPVSLCTVTGSPPDALGMFSSTRASD